MKSHPNRTLHIIVVRLKLNFHYFWCIYWVDRLHCLLLFSENVLASPGFWKGHWNCTIYCTIFKLMFAIWKWGIYPLNSQNIGGCVTCLDRCCSYNSVQLVNKNKCLPKREEAKEPRLKSPKTMWIQSQKLQTECWIGGKCCEHWQVIFWGYRCISWFRRFCTATVKKKKKKSLKCKRA